MGHAVVKEIPEAIASHPEWGFEVRISDLHVWCVGRNKFSCLLQLTSKRSALNAETVKQFFAIHKEIVRITAGVFAWEGRD